MVYAMGPRIGVTLIMILNEGTAFQGTGPLGGTQRVAATHSPGSAGNRDKSGPVDGAARPEATKVCEGER